jgi:hypothetical protein
MTASTASFPLKARVVLYGLVKAPDLNGKTGVVQSAISGDGRQNIRVMNKIVALKTSNLKYEERPVDSLSVTELKTILQKKNVADAELIGVDKSELKTRVSALTASLEEIAEILAHAPTVGAASNITHSASLNNNNNNEMRKGAEQISSMSPEQLRQQAQAMRSMDPDLIRRTNPQLMHMSNEQIRMAADQMEMMANNPQMMATATEQMKNMSPEEVQRMQRQMAGAPAQNTTAPASTSNASATTAKSPEQAADMMANMSPDQLRQQAQMMRSMPPEQLRQMNPQLAHMTDSQIQMSATQFEMMASNPEMMKTAVEQMKNISHEEMQNLQSQMGVGAAEAAGMMKDPTKLLESMDPKQLKKMLARVKNDPAMMKQFASMTGMNEEQISKGVEMFENMDDKNLDATLKVMAKASRAKDLWNNANAKTGGHLMKVLIAIALLIVYMLVQRFWFGQGVVENVAATFAEIEKKAASGVEPPVPVMEDEFADEL